jgi:hypothetical protein
MCECTKTGHVQAEALLRGAEASVRALVRLAGVFFTPAPSHSSASPRVSTTQHNHERHQESTGQSGVKHVLEAVEHGRVLAPDVPAALHRVSGNCTHRQQHTHTHCSVAGQRSRVTRREA